MPAPSSYFEATQKRFQDRGELLRRDIDIMLEGLRSKGQLLDELRARTLTHRQEDLAQLTEARRELWASWDERLKRIEEWMRASAILKQTSSQFKVWSQSARGFERLQDFADRYKTSLQARARGMQAELAAATEAVQSWEQRLCAQEAEIRGFLDRQAAKTQEIMVSRARKQPFLDFVYLERESEARLAAQMKTVRLSVNRTLERIARAQKWASDRASQNPREFAARQDAFQAQIMPLQRQFALLREKALELALTFEGGRQRLRWIYEQVQRMRVVAEAPAPKTPLLHRLFGSRDPF